jgi:AraC-like DNA-binding protein
LKKRDGVRVKDERPRGILHLRAGETASGLTRYWPSADLAPLVEHYWVVRWNLPEPRVAETVPHPCVHMVLEVDRSEVVGVMRMRFTRRLSGRGRVLGTRFRPGAFRAFMTRPVATLTGRSLRLVDVFGASARARTLEERALSHDDDQKAIGVVERFLRDLHPRQDEAMALAVRIAARVESDRSITRVAQLARKFGTSERALQRLFREYVGVGPKWVIQRHRLLEAAARAAKARAVDWSDLALELGFADQAHFIRDFKRLVGQPPAEYTRGMARSRASGSWWS